MSQYLLGTQKKLKKKNTHPYIIPAIEHLLNSIMFLVNVPVLSVKIYLTCMKIIMPEINVLYFLLH